MERLKLRYQQVRAALKSLEEPLEEISAAPNQRMHRIIRDSAIQRFEYTYEEFWKFLKEYLREFYGSEVETSKKIFREAQKANLCNDEEVAHLLMMVDDRNKTSHQYDEAIIDEIFGRIKTYYDLMSDILERIKTIE